MQSSAKQIIELSHILERLNTDEIHELQREVLGNIPNPIWTPLPGPQMDALESPADIVFFGGSAGGSKSDLLLGLGLTQHRRSIIYRREATQTVGLVDRLAEILGSREGWNSQQLIWRLPDRQIEFGSCKDPGDETRWQGRPHDFCVAEGTLVVMGDGTTKSIQSVIVGDYVQTLEGPRRVTKTFPARIDKSVLVTAEIGNNQFARQVQGLDHSILTTEGWVCHDMFFSSKHRSHVESEPILRHFAYNISKYLHTLLQAFSSPLLSKLKDLLRIPESFLSSHHLFSREFSFASDVSGLGIGSVAFENLRQGIWMHFLSTFLGGQIQPYRGLSLLNYFEPILQYGTSDVHADSLFSNSRVDYRLLPHLCDERVPRAGEHDSKCLLLRGGVELPIPICFVNDGRDKIPKRNFRKVSYDHPYTMEKRQILADILEASFSFSPSGLRKLYDIEIEDTNHYITDGGFVNKNCAFDEICNFLEHQFRFLCTWVRTTTKGQRCRVVCTGNPPTDEDGRWVIIFWGPWLDPKHPHPAKPGELRWYTTINGKDTEVPNGNPIRVNGVMVKPLSRTFIPSKVQDNPFLMGTNYEAVLQALPEPLRSQMLEGNFQAGIKDSEWQIIPTAWVEAAMARWKPEGKQGAMDSMGVDPSRGGIDKFEISTRYGPWYDKLISYPGSKVPDGATGAGLVVAALKDGAPVHVDVIGVGGSVVDHLRSNKIHVVAVNASEAAPEGKTDKLTKVLKFRNMRSFIWWRFRESLDPKTGDNVALPPDPELKADLCAPLWMLTPGGILVESKEDKIGADGVKVAGLKRRLGRSPGKGEAVVYCSIATPRRVRPKDLPQAQNLAKSYAVNVGPNRQYHGNRR